mgnify:CR=1 FL=1
MTKIIYKQDIYVQKTIKNNKARMTRRLTPLRNPKKTQTKNPCNPCLKNEYNYVKTEDTER